MIIRVLSSIDANTRIALICAGLVGAMVGMSFAAVPLYDLFCRVTGYGGTTQQAGYIPAEILDREVVVRFDASKGRGMPWEFEPIQTQMTVRLGEKGLAFYRATNTTDKPVTGIASYNVSPFKAGPYFAKLECFCFTEQTLQPGQSMDMPVMFFIDPGLDEKSNLDDIKTITLSYTFFEAGGDDQGLYDTAFALENSDEAF